MKRYSFVEGFRFWKCFDVGLFFSMLALILIGLVSIYATGATEAFQKQCISLGLGLIVYFVFAAIDYRQYKKWAEILYAISIFLLIMVIGLGYESYGAQRWIDIRGFNFQPSEFTKWALIIVMAKFLELRQQKLNSIIEAIPSFILIGIPFFLIARQPDLGTALVLIAIFSFMSLWAGMQFSRLALLASPLISILLLYLIPLYPLVTWAIYLVLLVFFLSVKRIPFADSIVFFALNVLSGVFSPFLWNSLSLYQKNRILAFINPDVDPLAQGVRYHTAKAMIAIGSGGLLGKGFMHGPLTNLQYIPEQHTDFVFSVIGEEFGLIGTILVVMVFVYLFYRLLNIALQSNNPFGRLLVVGVLAMSFFQTFINIGMNIGLVPVVGLPLPLVSFGGTSLLVFMALLGMVQSVVMRQRDLIF